MDNLDSFNPFTTLLKSHRLGVTLHTVTPLYCGAKLADILSRKLCPALAPEQKDAIEKIIAVLGEPTGEGVRETSELLAAQEEGVRKQAQEEDAETEAYEAELREWFSKEPRRMGRAESLAWKARANLKKMSERLFGRGEQSSHEPFIANLCAFKASEALCRAANIAFSGVCEMRKAAQMQTGFCEEDDDPEGQADQIAAKTLGEFIPAITEAELYAWLGANPGLSIGFAEVVATRLLGDIALNYAGALHSFTEQRYRELVFGIPKTDGYEA
jgi:hypothetical protein